MSEGDIIWHCIAGRWCSCWWTGPESDSPYCKACRGLAEPHNDCQRRRELRAERKAKDDELRERIRARGEAKAREQLDALIRQYGVPEWASKGREQ